MEKSSDGISNEAFQGDNIELNEVSNAAYHIPRVTSERRNERIPEKEMPPIGFYKMESELTDKDSMHTVDIYKPQNALEESDSDEDYSLFSFFKRKNRYDVESNFNKNQNIPKFSIPWKYFLCVLLLLAYCAYFIAVLIIHSKAQNENFWCDGDGFLIIVTLIFIIGFLYFQIIKKYLLKRWLIGLNNNPTYQSLITRYNLIISTRCVRLSLYFLFIAVLMAFFIYDVSGNYSRLIPLFGIFSFITFGFIFSSAPRKVNWRHVVWGMGLQLVLGLIILRWSIGKEIFTCIGSKVEKFLNYTNDGSGFVFGILVTQYAIFAFKILSVVIFFSLCIQILYYYGAMQWVVLKLGWLLQITIGTTACESVNASANIFLGMSEAPLLIKPFLSDMTKSELHAVLTGGFATIAGSVLAAYISFGVDASHLLSASVMSAPAALAYSKLFYPETKISKTNVGNIKTVQCSETNALHAAIEGVSTALKLVANIAGNLIAFISFVAFIDAVLEWGCSLLDVEEGTCKLSNIFGYIFMPVAWLMGVSWDNCYWVGQLIGTKTIVNEFVAYIQLKKIVDDSKNLHWKIPFTKRSEIISTYALCGFSNIGSIGIQLGALGSMVPHRRADLSKIAVRAMIAGNIACFLTACIAGILVSTDEVDHNMMNNGSLALNASEF